MAPGNPEAILGPGESWVWYPATGKTGALDAFTVKVWDGVLASANAVQANIQVDLLPNLQPTAAGSSIWQSAEPGTFVDWTVTVKNNGPGPQWADWTVQWYLSSDNKYQISDTLIGSATYSDDIAKGGSVSKTLNAAVPAVPAAGQKYLIARVVNAWPDAKANNNTKAGSDRDWFGPAAADSDEPNEAADDAADLGYVAGTRSWNSKTLDNQADVDCYEFTTLGPAAKSHKVQVDFANTEGDLALGVYRTDGSPVKEVDGTGNSEQVSLSGLAEGTYYVKVWSNRSDVTRNYKLTIVAPTGPDLQPTAVDSSVWQSAEPGTSAGWMVTVKNNGPGYQRTDWTVQWYLSTDNKYQASDTPIGSVVYSDGIAPGASVSKTLNAAVPSVPAVGQKYLIARIVSAGPESKTSNDIKVASDRDWFGLVAPDPDEDSDTFETAKDLAQVPQLGDRKDFFCPAEMR